MSCLTTTAINCVPRSIFAVNCLDRCWTADLVLNFRQQEETQLGGGDNDGPLNRVPKVSTLHIFRHCCMMFCGKYDSTLIKYSVQSAFGPHIVSPWCIQSSLVCSL